MSTPPDQILDNRLFEEWKEARHQITTLDDTLAGLRKYGFTFITALLAADSILGQATASATVTLSPEVKPAVFASTLILVAGLYATDNFYSIVQKGAVARARQIEDHFGKGGLTNTISKFYGSKYLWLYIEFLYASFALAAQVLALIVLYPSGLLATLMTIATGATLLFIYALRRAGPQPNLWASP